MVTTVAASSPAKNSSPSPWAAPSNSPMSKGSPETKCSMMAPRTTGLRFGQSPPDFVTEMKSEPKNTPETPSIANSACASGDCPAPSASLVSSVPCGKTGQPGRNFTGAGLGVACGSSNMEFSQTSGLRPELDRGTGIILKYDGERG